MKLRPCALAFAFAMVCATFARQTGVMTADTGPTPHPSPLASHYVGAGSCSASACHNAGHGSTGSEYTTWITRDPHARAFEALFNERSKLIQKNLQRKVAAHDDARCLRCHVAPDYDDARPPPAAPYFKTDGVSCESCHGPAKDWINHHHLDAWRLKTPIDKKSLGMNDTRSLAGRTQLCASCHVGAAGMDVDHELIAAGHPRLHFEFAAFHAHMPRHWPDAKDRVKPDFETRAWLAGQLVTAHAALELLAERTSQTHVWPEFAEFDCAACHHNLQASSPRQKLGFGPRKPGVLPWGHQVALTSVALQKIADTDKVRARIQALQKLMDAGNPNRDAVATEARGAALQLRQVLDRLDADFVDATPDRELLRSLLLARGKKAVATTDELTQIYLGLAALGNKSVLPIAAPSFHRFDPDAILARLSLFKNANKGP